MNHIIGGDFNARSTKFNVGESFVMLHVYHQAVYINIYWIYITWHCEIGHVMMYQKYNVNIMCFLINVVSWSTKWLSKLQEILKYNGKFGHGSKFYPFYFGKSMGLLREIFPDI